MKEKKYTTQNECARNKNPSNNHQAASSMQVFVQ